MNVLLIIFCAFFAVTLLVFVVVRALAVSDKIKAYKKEAAELGQTKSKRKYTVDVVQQGGRVRIESGSKITAVDGREEK